MRQTKVSLIAVVFGAFFWLLPSVGEAATKTVDCSKKSLQDAIKKAKPGDTLLVSGTCDENILIPEQVLNITLDGQGQATISDASGGTENTINVRGRGITIKGFTITGGFRAIAMQNGGAAIITENTIQTAQTFGVQISRNSFARVLNNTIKNNGQDGVNVRLGASADIFDNDITGNRDGVNVDGGGSADVSGNHIFSNTRDGVNLRDNSHVRFSADPDNTTENMIETNGDNGVDCARDGTISGSTPVNFGAGNTGGNTDIENSCHVQDLILP